jgi:hypothetical protein
MEHPLAMASAAITSAAVAANDLVYLEVGVPVELRDAVERHHRHLGTLVQQLRQAGMSEGDATACVDLAIDSYRDALAAAVTRMRRSTR